MGDTFKDSEGREWSPRITLHALEGFARETGLSLEQLVDFKRLKIQYLVAAVWHSVAAQAQTRKGGSVARDDFAAAVGLKQMGEAIRIVMAQVEAEFPEAAAEVEEEAEKMRGAMGGGEDADPLPPPEETDRSSNASAT